MIHAVTHAICDRFPSSVSLKAWVGQAFLITIIALPVLAMSSATTETRYKLPDATSLEGCLRDKAPFNDEYLASHGITALFVNFVAQRLAGKVLVEEGLLMGSYLAIKDLIRGEDGWTGKPLSADLLAMDRQVLEIDPNVLSLIMAHSLTTCAEQL